MRINHDILGFFRFSGFLNDALNSYYSSSIRISYTQFMFYACLRKPLGLTSGDLIIMAVPFALSGPQRFSPACLYLCIPSCKNINTKS